MSTSDEILYQIYQKTFRERPSQPASSQITALPVREDTSMNYEQQEAKNKFKTKKKEPIPDTDDSLD